jgi:hypothetical protein
MDQIQYIGKKPEKRDNVAGTGLVWTPGQAHPVEDPKKVALLLAHPDVWARVDLALMAANAQALRDEEEATRQRREQAERQLAEAEERARLAEVEAQAAEARAKAAEQAASSDAGLTNTQAPASAPTAPGDMDVEDLRAFCASKGWDGHPQTGKPKLLAWLKENDK